MKDIYEFDGKQFKYFRLLNLPDFKEPEKIKYNRQEKTKEQIGNNIMILDIEATSFEENDEHLATMYIWMLSIDDEYVFGRTWEELRETLDYITTMWELDNERKATIFIHNLAYEFNWFLCNPIFNFSKMFLKDKGHPLYAEDHRGFIFRCTYMMTNKALKDFDAPVSKLVGDLDYDLYRHSKTEITDKEMHYCFRDIYIPQFYIKKQLEKYTDLWKIPLTKTGFVRQKVRAKCFEFDKYFNLNIKKQQPNEEIYAKLKEAYQGGYTHANYRYVDQIQEDITCIDFTSSYPATMLCKLPMSEWKEMLNPSLAKVKSEINAGTYAMMITFYARNIQKTSDHSIISVNKCLYKEGAKIDNGKIWKAKLVKLTLTDYDFKIFMNFYKCEEIKIEQVYINKYGYLPQPIVECMLDYYEAKTTLKGVEGREEDYQLGKEDVNSLYGMCVSDIVHSVIEWDKDKEDFIEYYEKEAVEQLEDYANSWTTFLVYSWGVWITARARYNLLKTMWQIGIDEPGDQVVYCDTDSIKFKNGDKFKDIIEKYNQEIVAEEEKCLKFYNMPVERLRPKTVKGVEKPLGVFDYEEPYKKMITQGAKKYMTEYYDGHFQMTVAGCSKQGIHFIQAIAYRIGCNPLELFKDGFEWGEEYSGRNTAYHKYEHFKTKLIDYNGVEAEVEEWSYINISKTTYKLGKTREFENYIMGVYQEREDGSYLAREEQYGK